MERMKAAHFTVAADVEQSARWKQAAEVAGHLSIGTWRFFSDLEHAESATFYKSVGSLGRIFMEIETEAFSLST